MLAEWLLSVEKIKNNVTKQQFKMNTKNKRVERLEKRENKLVAKGNKAVDEGRDKKAGRILGRAAKVEDQKIKIQERKKK